MKPNKILLGVVFSLSVSFSFAQSQTAIPKNPAPGNIKMLDGYIHQRKNGIDSRVGEMTKASGLTIRYDIGRMAGNYALSFSSREKQNTIWLKTQKINNEELTILYLKDGNIYASFTDSHANFMTNVKTNEELADFLLMILTYSPDKAQK